MKHLTPLCLAAILGATPALSAPLCSEFTSQDLMPAKYRKLAPVLSGGSTDWIITADQMKTDYTPPAEVAGLLAQIVAEFEARGTRLAIMMAPPRPIVAGQDTLDALSGGTAAFDTAAVAATFDTMMDVIRDSGAIAPNLLEVALSNEDLRDAYYYRHDTHWTPRGAARSAIALAEAVIAADVPAFVGAAIAVPDLNAGPSFTEKGSLAGMAKAVCGASIAPVETNVPVFPSSGLGLLDDTSNQPRVLLAGSSFSNRYKKDAYRVADAIAATLKAEVVNHSVSGGGAIGAIEGIVNAGLLSETAAFDLVVWELPYTQAMKSAAPLRQLLGALRYDPARNAVTSALLDGSGETRLEIQGPAPSLLALNVPETTAQRIKVDLRYADGHKNTVSLVRKSQVPAQLLSPIWAINIENQSAKTLSSVTVRYKASDIKPGSFMEVF